MELVQKIIQVRDTEQVITHQIPLREDVNVPDAKEDMIRILQSYEKVGIKSCTPKEQYLEVKGVVGYQILYATEEEEGKISCVEGQVSFEEMIYVDGNEKNQYTVKCNQMDVQASLIHSRKICLQGMLELEVQKSQVNQRKVTVDIDTESTLYKKTKSISILALVSEGRDTYRMKEEIKIPGTKENIGTILLTRMHHMKLDVRAGRDEMLLRGETQFFCMYRSEEWKEDYIEQTITFEGKIDCNGMEEGHYHNVRYEIDELSVDTQMDEDGELRILNVEATVKMDIQIYEEIEVEVLEDAYLVNQKCELEREQVFLERLVQQSQSKCKIMETLMLPELKDELLQICTAQGRVQIEQTEEMKDGIIIEGVLHVDFLYVKDDDACPYASWQGMIPFTHRIECVQSDEKICDMECYLEQITISVAGNGEIEVKAVMNFQNFIRSPQTIQGIQGVEVVAFTKDELEKQAGIIGYIYKEKDDLWNLAKRFHTTEEGILKINKINEKDIKAGQKLLIFKENMSIL